ncbi:MAG: hypothetical protein GYA24_05235 [Candidatus Lokiarchaeota archaeon]|nr:hypothetical protein [Candidatus Lokiarchaeota archaeon]
MGQKTISLTPDAFEKLKRAKRSNESFSELVTRLLESESRRNKPRISDCFGTLVEKEPGEWDKILEDIYKDKSRPRSKDTRLEG